MIRNYIRVALRNLRRHPAYAAINVAGLAVGMAVCLLVALFAHDQASYDRFHAKADRIVRVVTDVRDPGESMALAASPAYVGPLLEEHVPQVEETVRLAQIRTNVIRDGESFYMEGLYAEPSFFALFDFRVIRGNAATALAAPGQVLLSEQAAALLFGDAEPVGRVVTLEDHTDFTVAGVVATEGVKTHLRFDVLASWATLETLDWGQVQIAEEVNFWNFANYVLLRQGATTDALETTLAAASRRYTAPGYVMGVQSLSDIALGEPRSNEIASYSLPAPVVWFLAALALVIMAAASFNYVGLATARALGRAREVGVRKTVGARRPQIVAQFLIESVLVTGAALVLAYGLLALLVPAFNGLHQMQRFDVALSLDDAFRPSLLAQFLLFSIGVGLLAGGYPALFLSRFRPSRVLKGSVGERGTGGLTLRKALIVVQLTLSVVFLVTVVLLHRQFHYMTESDYGFRTDDILNVPLAGNDYDLLRGEWLRHAGVQSVAATYEPPATGSVMGMALVTARGDSVQVVGYSVDADYIVTTGLTLLAGGTVASGRPGVVVNETALGALGVSTPAEAIGTLLDLDHFEEPQPVVGVVRDYRFNHAMQPTGPLVLFNDPALFRWAVVRLHPGARSAALAHLASVWRRLDPVHAFDPRPGDEQLRDNDITRAFRDGLRIIGLLSAIALTIAGLGLASMAAARAQSRTREVGIRKALGATEAGLVLLISREFLRLLVVAVVIAIPLAWFVSSRWLSQFAYRTALGPDVFALGIVGVLLVTLVAVGSQALRAATADPVRALRNE